VGPQVVRAAATCTVVLDPSTGKPRTLFVALNFHPNAPPPVPTRPAHGAGPRAAQPHPLPEPVIPAGGDARPSPDGVGCLTVAWSGRGDIGRGVITLVDGALCRTLGYAREVCVCVLCPARALSPAPRMDMQPPH